MDPEKECAHCGAFPHKAYHERAATKALGVAKWVQNAPAMQPNQKLSEEIEKTDSNIITFEEFTKIKR